MSDSDEESEVDSAGCGGWACRWASAFFFRHFLMARGGGMGQPKVHKGALAPLRARYHTELLASVHRNEGDVVVIDPIIAIISTQK